MNYNMIIFCLFMINLPMTKFIFNWESLDLLKAKL
jgi:hypothetical protein